MLVQNFGALRQFVPAELKHNSKGWYIEYYKLNPIVQDLERVRLMMNRERKRCKTLTEFKLQTSAIILQINNQRYYSSNQQSTCCRFYQSSAKHPCLWYRYAGKLYGR